MGGSKYGFGRTFVTPGDVSTATPVVNNAATTLFDTKAWIESPTHPDNLDTSR
jgi:hypothetical protein